MESDQTTFVLITKLIFHFYPFGRPSGLTRKLSSNIANCFTEIQWFFFLCITWVEYEVTILPNTKHPCLTYLNKRKKIY